MAGLEPGREKHQFVDGEGGEGRCCHYLLYCRQTAFSAVHMGASTGDRVSRLQAKAQACLCFTANQVADTLRTPGDCTSLLSMSMSAH